MKRLSKYVFASVAALALLSPGITPVSSALTGGQAQAHDAYYVVYYRACCHSPWIVYGAYDCPCDANSTALWIRAQGYQASVAPDPRHDYMYTLKIQEVPGQ